MGILFWCGHVHRNTSYDNISILAPLNTKTFSVYRPTRRVGGGVSMFIMTLYMQGLSRNSVVERNILQSCLRAVGWHDDCHLCRPPDASVLEFLNFLDEIFSHVNQDHFYVVISGDFNVNMSDGNPRKVGLENVFTCNCGKNCIAMPTVTLPSNTVLRNNFGHVNNKLWSICRYNCSSLLHNKWSDGNLLQY